MVTAGKLFIAEYQEYSLKAKKKRCNLFVECYAQQIWLGLHLVSNVVYVECHLSGTRQRLC